MIKQLLAVITGIITFTACSFKEEISLHPNNSIDRNTLVHLDTVTVGKIMDLAAMMGQQRQNMPFDSMAMAWGSVGAALTRLSANDPRTRISYKPWDRKTASGSVNFSMPSLDAYNDFSAHTLTGPAAMTDQVPLGGPQKQKIEWLGKDTLLITLDNSKSPQVQPIANEAEIKQSMGALKMMLGLDAFIKYEASFHLPRSAKNATGKGVTLSADKKTIHINRELDEAAQNRTDDQIVVVF